MTTPVNYLVVAESLGDDCIKADLVCGLRFVPVDRRLLVFQDHLKRVPLLFDNAFIVGLLKSLELFLLLSNFVDNAAVLQASEDQL
jgi:hypothetical protein